MSGYRFLLSVLKSAIGIILFTALSACSGIKEAGVVYHDSFDFSAVESYSLYERNSVFGENQSLLSTHRNTIEIAIERSMANQHFSYQALDKADVIVTYHVLNNSRDYVKYNEMIRFCTHCLRATAWATDRQYSAIRRGSLILDLVDPKQNRSVWRSVYPLGLEAEENSADTNDKIKKAVSAMLAEYPR